MDIISPLQKGVYVKPHCSWDPVHTQVQSDSPWHSFRGSGVSAQCRRSGCSELLFAEEMMIKKREKVTARTHIEQNILYSASTSRSQNLVHKQQHQNKLGIFLSDNFSVSVSTVRPESFLQLGLRHGISTLQLSTCETSVAGESVRHERSHSCVCVCLPGITVNVSVCWLSHLIRTVMA